MPHALDRALVDKARPSRAPVPHGQPAQRRPPNRRLTLLALAVVVVTLLTALSMHLLRSRADGFRIAHFSVPVAYHATYVVKSAGTPTTTEQLWVNRPFEDVDMTLGREALGGQASESSTPSSSAYLSIVNRLGAQVLRAGSADAGELRVPAAAAPQDVRADIIVPAGLRAGWLKVVGSRVVLGRRCELLRSAAPLRSGPLRPITTSKTYTDTCIDATGIVLAETTVQNGHVTTQRQAVSVAIGPAAVAGASFEQSGTPTPFGQGGGAFTALTLSSRPPGGSWALQRLPSGFSQVGKYAVIPAQPQVFGQIDASPPSPSGLPGGLVSELDDVFVRGADMIVLQQGSTLNGATFAPPKDAQDVDLGALGRGQITMSGSQVTVSAEPDGGRRFVRLSGTLPPDVLVALARSLASQPAGTLTRLSGGTR